MNITVPLEDRFFLKYLNLNMEEGPWIAGGSVMKWVQGKPVKHHDVDVFCASEKQFEDVTARCAAMGVKCGIVANTENAVTYELRDKHGNKTHNLQVIKKHFFQTARDVILAFDLVVCQFVTDGKQVVHTNQAMTDLKTKRINIASKNGSLPKRILKYMTYGFAPSEQTIEYIQNHTEEMSYDYTGAVDYDNAFG